jgi:hypothetical protein
MTSSDHSGFNALGGRKLEPVCSEPQIPPRHAEHLERDAAAAEVYARTALGMVDDSRRFTLDEYVAAKVRRDNRMYNAVCTAFGVMLALAVTAVAVDSFVRTKPVTLDRMPVVSERWPCSQYTSDKTHCSDSAH